MNSRRTLNHGRPRIASKEDLLDFLFAVPSSPDIRVVDRKKTSPRNDDEGLRDDDSVRDSPTSPVKSVSKSLPFPDAFDPSTRHAVCDDSLRPWSYLLTLPGKNVRDQLIEAFNNWISLNPSKLTLVKQVSYIYLKKLIHC